MKRMNRSTKFAFTFCTIICVIILLIIVLIDTKNENKEDIFQNTVSIYKKQEVMYAEGDEDAAYNYIENPYALKNTEMPYIGCLSLNDEIDKFLREHDYISEVLTIKNAYEKGTIIYFEVLIGDSNDYLSIEYDIRYNEYKIALKKYKKYC